MRTLTFLLAATLGASAHAATLDDVDAAVAALPAAVVSDFANAPFLNTRHDAIRFTHASLDQKGVIPWMLQRLQDGSTSDKLQLGYAEAVIRHLRESDGTWFDAWTQLAGTHPNAAVRVILVEGFAAVDAATLRAGVRAAATDADADVRAAAARTAGLSPFAAETGAAMRTLADDVDASVRAQALRTLGIIGDSTALSVVRRGLSDADGTVRLHALRALQRLDLGQAQEAARSMRGDADPRVARFAASL